MVPDSVVDVPDMVLDDLARCCETLEWNAEFAAPMILYEIFGDFIKPRIS